MSLKVKLNTEGNIIKYPYTYVDLITDNPNVSFPADIDAVDLSEFNVYSVNNIDRPLDTSTHKVVESLPEFVDGAWQQVWSMVEKTTQEKQAYYEALQNIIVTSVQNRLDDFAKSRNYDGVLSACTYYTSSVDKFRIEAQYMMEARDATWSTLYWVLSEVTAGNISVPTSYSDVEAYLPALHWPVVVSSNITIGIE